MNALSLACLAALLATTVRAQDVPDVADFVFPRLAEDPQAARAVKEPAKVAVHSDAELGKPVLDAASEQDAVNKAAAVQRGDAAKGDPVAAKLREAGSGAHFIRTPSGTGVVATGGASYRADYPNETLRLARQRMAWVEAQLRAKNALAELLGGTSLQGRQSLAIEQARIDDPQGGLLNREQLSSEQISKTMSRFLHGIVTYDVDDDPEGGRVQVTVISTPRTQGRSVQTSERVTNASSMQEGIEELFREIRMGVVPPDGGRIVTVPATGEVAWVAFGSEVIASDRDAGLERSNADTARSIAETRAARNLLAILDGEALESSVQVEEQLRELVKDFERRVSECGAEEIVALAERQYETLRSQIFRERFGSTVAGTLPAGRQSRSYVSEDGKWAYCIQLWFASSESLAEGVLAEMRRNSPLGNAARRIGEYERNPDGSLKVDAEGRVVPKSLGRGRVTSDDDL